MHFADPKAEAHTGGTVASYMTSTSEVNDVFRGLGYWITASEASEVNLETIILKASKSPIKGKALKELVIAAIFEGMGAEPRSADEIKSAEKESAAKASEIKKAVKAELIAGEVKKLNKRPASERLLASPIKKVDFSKVNLAGAKLAGFEFRHCNFTGANLSKVDLSKGVAASCDFTNANLKEAKLTGCDLSNSVFIEADATKAVLSEAFLTRAKMNKTNFTGANFSQKKGDYRSFHKHEVDLSTCNLKGADFTNCTYDAKTRLPAECSKTMLEKMEWCGPGLPPDQRKHSKKAAGATGFRNVYETPHRNYRHLTAEEIAEDAQSRFVRAVQRGRRRSCGGRCQKPKRCEIGLLLHASTKRRIFLLHPELESLRWITRFVVQTHFSAAGWTGQRWRA